MIQLCMRRHSSDMQKSVLVGMSGGVDSSVAAALLVKAGYRVVGGFIKNWSDSKDVWSGECQWRGERRDAMRVAAKLGIPLLTFDFEDAYRERVIKPLFEGYAHGITPNPDVLCNEFIKFGLFWEEAKRLKFDFVGTGHYARVRSGRTACAPSNNPARLLRGIDPEKDQSYFLHRINQNALEHALFPVGDKKKSEVRRIARSLGLSTAGKAESMGICFIGKQDMTDFLRTRIPSKPGDVVDPNCHVIGRHDGLDSVTIGQRHGFQVTQAIGLPGDQAGSDRSVGRPAARPPGRPSPWYAAAKDPATNCLMVVPGREHPALYASEAIVTDLHWVTGESPAGKRGLSAIVRYRQDAVPVRVEEDPVGADGVRPERNMTDVHKEKIILHFKKPVFAVAPGQSAVIYKGSECLGGGIIEK
jgi:tRNA-uridine 2-sulfurtransferase